VDTSYQIGTVLAAKALTSPALLSQRERREKEIATAVGSCSPLSLWGRGEASEGVE
jgi:hypothetical protein